MFFRPSTSDQTRVERQTRRPIAKNMVGRTRRTQVADRCGACVVEFAFVAPIMILLTMGMMEMGRVVMVKQLMVNASREGARLAVLPVVTAAEVEAVVQDELTRSNVLGATITIIPENFEAAAAGTSITVQIEIDAADVSWVPNPLFTVETILNASTTMRKEG